MYIFNIEIFSCDQQSPWICMHVGQSVVAWTRLVLSSIVQAQTVIIATCSLLKWVHHVWLHLLLIQNALLTWWFLIALYRSPSSTHLRLLLGLHCLLLQRGNWLAWMLLQMLVLGVWRLANIGPNKRGLLLSIIAGECAVESGILRWVLSMCCLRVLALVIVGQASTC